MSGEKNEAGTHPQEMSPDQEDKGDARPGLPMPREEPMGNRRPTQTYGSVREADS